MPIPPPHENQKESKHACMLFDYFLNLNKPSLGLLLHGDGDDLGFWPWQYTAGQVNKTHLTYSHSMKKRHGQHTSSVFAAVGCVNTRSGLPIRWTEMKVMSEIQKTPSTWTQWREMTVWHFFGRIYSHFTILLEDVVCLFRVYVNQSGNKGLSIAQTDRGNQLAC